MKIGTLLLEFVENAIGQHDTFAPHIQRQIKQQRHIRLQMLIHPMLEPETWSDQASPTAW